MDRRYYVEKWGERGDRTRLWYAYKDENITVPAGMEEITRERFDFERKRLKALHTEHPDDDRYARQYVFPLRRWRGKDVDYRTPPVPEFKATVDPPIRYRWVGYGAPAKIGELAED